jgi:hypothetical protein
MCMCNDEKRDLKTKFQSVVSSYNGKLPEMCCANCKWFCRASYPNEPDTCILSLIDMFYKKQDGLDFSVDLWGLCNEFQHFDP